MNVFTRFFFTIKILMQFKKCNDARVVDFFKLNLPSMNLLNNVFLYLFVSFFFFFFFFELSGYYKVPVEIKRGEKNKLELFLCFFLSLQGMCRSTFIIQICNLAQVPLNTK
jgi:hypothetical protein